MPKISVIMPVWNRPRHLARALQSLSAQTFDDASDDSPDEEVAAFHDKRLRLIRRDQNGGPSAARATGFGQMSGDVLALLDSDNTFYPWTLDRAWTILEANPLVDCVTGLYVFPTGLRTRVKNHERIVSPEEYRRLSAKGDSDCVGVVRRSVVNSWQERRLDFFSFEFHLWFWMSLNSLQLYVDEPWGQYFTDADHQVTRQRDPRSYEDMTKFVTEYRPLVGVTPCVPLDECLSLSWFRLRRAGRHKDAEFVEAWMRDRGLTRLDALRDAAQRRLSRRNSMSVKWM